MDTIVQSNTSLVVTTEMLSSTVVDSSIETVVIGGDHSTTLVHNPNSTVLVETSTPTVVVTGLMGPPGISEEEIMYSKRIDFISDYEIYKGDASVGSSESAGVWRIRKIIISNVDSDVTELWASGNANFDKVWADRLSLIYS